MDSLKVTDAVSAAVAVNKATRVTLDSMLEKVVSKEFINPPSAPLMTICVITLQNGFVLVGKTAPADPENFNAYLGRKFSEEDAMRQMWPLEGYLMRERLAVSS